MESQETVLPPIPASYVIDAATFTHKKFFVKTFLPNKNKTQHANL